VAVGDAAGAKGLKTYDDTLLVKDIDTALNQRGDETAAVMTRADKLEAQTMNVPKFFVKRSSNGQNVKAETWTQLTAGAWGKPTKTVGAFTWAGGALTVPKAGIYDIRGHVMFRNNDFRTVSLNITRNSTTPDSAASIAGNETTVESPDTGTKLQLGVTAAEFAPLNAGDVLRFYVLQRSRGAEQVNVGDRTFDLTFNVLWVDSL
jgi:hypothetical protein